MADLTYCRVSAEGNYGAGANYAYTGKSEQIMAQMTMPGLTTVVPGLTMSSRTGSSSHLGSPYNTPAQVYPDAVQLNYPYGGQCTSGLMPSSGDFGLGMSCQPNVYSSPDPSFYSNDNSNIDPSLLHCDTEFFEMLVGTGASNPASTSRSPFTSGVPSVQVSAATPAAAGPMSPSRGISPSLLMRQQLQQPSLTSPQPSLVFSSSGSGYSSRSHSPGHSRSRSGTASPVIAGSASVSRRQMPTYF